MKYFNLFKIFSVLLLDLIICRFGEQVLNDDVKDVTNLNLLNYRNSLYFINIVIGSNKAEIPLTLETANNDFFVIGKDCISCNREINKYDYAGSKSYTGLGVKKSFFFKNNHSSLQGELSKDLISLYRLEKYNEHQFVLIKNETLYSSYNFNGKLGIGFSKTKDNFIWKLKEYKVIDKAIYSLLLRNVDEYSLISLSGYDKDIMKNETHLQYFDIEFKNNNDGATEWFLNFDSIDLFDMQISVPKAQKVVLSSGTNLIHVPYSFFMENKENFFSNKTNCQFGKDNLFHCTCDNIYNLQLFPSFRFKNGNSSIYINSLDYVTLEENQFDYGGGCILLLNINYANDIWILGTIFMKNYYTVFDLENNQLGFYDIRDSNFSDVKGVMILSLIIIAASILFFLIIYCLYKKVLTTRRSRMNSNNNEYSFINENNR